MKNPIKKIHSRSWILPLKLQSILFVSLLWIMGSCSELRDDDISDDLSILSQSLSGKFGKIGISDAANGGIDEFYFLAPTVGKTPKYKGKFHPNLQPVVEISDDFEFKNIHASFEIAGSASERITVNESEENYAVNWNTSNTKAVTGKIYRVRVRIAERVLGFVDVGIVPSPTKQLESGVIPVVRNQSFRIEFRIEDKICPARIEVLPPEATVLLDGEQQFTAIVYNFYDEVLEDQDITWGVSDPGVGSINQSGLAKGLAFGFTEVTAKVEDVTGTAFLFVQESGGAPRPGKDVVVFNDFNIFDSNRMSNPNNQLLVKNLINFSTPGIRNEGTKIWFDCGRDSRFTVIDTPPACGSSAKFDPLRNLIQEEGFTLEDISSSSGSLVSIPNDVKVLFLWLPMVPYTVDEINALKSFANEGGRIVFIGEWDGYYTTVGLAVENQFLINMGAFMRNVGNAINCGNVLLPETSLRPHPITRDMTDITIACASVIELGPDDFALFYDQSNTLVLAGVAQIDTNPITELESLRLENNTNARLKQDLDPKKATGW